MGNRDIIKYLYFDKDINSLYINYNFYISFHGYTYYDNLFLWNLIKSKIIDSENEIILDIENRLFEKKGHSIDIYGNKINNYDENNYEWEFKIIPLDCLDM